MAVFAFFFPSALGLPPLGHACAEIPVGRVIAPDHGLKDVALNEKRACHLRDVTALSRC